MFLGLDRDSSIAVYAGSESSRIKLFQISFIKKMSWRILVTEQLMLAIDVHSILLHTKEVNGYQQLFVTNILQDIFFSAQQKKETHTSLEQLKGE